MRIQFDWIRSEHSFKVMIIDRSKKVWYLVYDDSLNGRILSLNAEITIHLHFKKLKPLVKSQEVLLDF